MRGHVHGGVRGQFDKLRVKHAHDNLKYYAVDVQLENGLPRQQQIAMGPMALFQLDYGPKLCRPAKPTFGW